MSDPLAMQDPRNQYPDRPFLVSPRLNPVWRAG